MSHGYGYKTIVLAAALGLAVLSGSIAGESEPCERPGFSWTALTERLESGVIPPGVSLDSLRTRVVGGHCLIDVSGESAGGYEGFVTFLDNLQENPHFLWVYPRSARKAARGSQDVAFELSFHFFPEPGHELSPEALAELNTAFGITEPGDRTDPVEEP